MLNNLLNGPYSLLIKIGLGLGISGLIIGSILWYGHSKYKSGVEDTDNKWKEASILVEKKIEESSDKADIAELEIVEKRNVELAEQKKKLDEAEANNSSYFDALFGISDSM